MQCSYSQWYIATDGSLTRLVSQPGVDPVFLELLSRYLRVAVKGWGESGSELVIKKTVTRNCTQYSFTWVFLTFVHVVFKFVSCVLLLV